MFPVKVCGGRLQAATVVSLPSPRPIVRAMERSVPDDGISVKDSKTKEYQAKYPARFVTATSLFDGHDAAINIMRRILQSSGAEVIHLGHDRSVEEVVKAAIEEDANALAVSSY